MKRILVLFGTRPEAIKLCPLLLQLRKYPDEFEVKACVTAQHRTMLDQVLATFQIIPDYDLNLMLPGQTLFQSTSRMLAAMEPVFLDFRPDLAIVQGDTTTTLAGALGAFYSRVPVGHVEAGLRTFDLAQPFPEEMNRVVATRLATLHFAATAKAADNLLREGVAADAISITGNTGIDAVLIVKAKLESGQLHGQAWPQLDSNKKLIVVTAHRRESFGAGFERICSALKRLSERNDIQIVYPVHPNPNVRDSVGRLLGNSSNILLPEPLDYVSFVDLMRRAYLIVTDSGGVQEEGPSLGKPILVLREKTERPEAVEAGTVRLVGSDPEMILTQANLLLDSPREYRSMSRVHNPYGDGHASERISDSIRSFLSR